MIEFSGRDSYGRHKTFRVSSAAITYAERYEDGHLGLYVLNQKWSIEVRDHKEAARVWEELRIAWTAEVRP